ncbi:MAG: bifunctional heptose 7-phosphate kinase/heptose 1-phosphate adenyltransferase [Planctomycetes bacterium]|nr:bifunctional heptose 7-phosphate kinase/heptose 1-phosphate adenyltransferase [Planctomycetota bacterium]
MNTRLIEIVGRLKAPRIFVLGDLILDKYVWGSVSRISPEAPVPVVNVKGEEYRPGGASNVVTNLAALGARVATGGIVGMDEEGARLLKLLRARGDVSAVLRDGGKPTPLKTRMLAHHQQMLRVDQERVEPIPPATQARLLAAALRQAARADLAIISDYSKGTLPPELCRKFIRRAGCPVLVGLKSHDHRKYAKATGASLNRSELRQLTHEDDVDRGARKLLKELSLRFLVVTLGEKGMRVISRDEAPITLSAAAREVFDVTGAGDTALAAFGVAYASGLPLEECAILSNAAAAIVVGKIGTETVTREELIADGHRKILTLPALVRALQVERKRGRRVVFTNGCFDLVHAGHASSLEFARSKGDVLVVGLNSDKSVRGLKGAGRPLVPQGERARLLAAFEAVDYVVVFDQGTPAALLKRLRPDVLVKGDDYRGKEVVGREHAGRVELAPLVKGVSTSEIIRRIRQL